MERSSLFASDLQTSANTAELLREAADLFLVHIVPADVVGREVWEQDGDRFSLELGKAAAGFFAAEFANAVSLGDCKTGRLQIGVAGGRSVFGLFNALPPFPSRKDLRVEISPLVIGPVPHSLFSASSVAEMAVQKFPSANVPPPAEIRLTNGHFELVPISLRKSDITDFDWLVLGVGSARSDGLTKHLTIIDDYDEETKSQTVGDMCSRLFDACGRELGREISDKFVRLELADLANLARRDSPQITRVVAIAGGRNKVDAMATLLRVRPRLINILVTDELTARAIIRRLRVPREGSAANDPTAKGIEPIPPNVLQKHQGKWIVWDQDAGRVLGVGESLDEAELQAEPAMAAGHLLRFHHVNWSNELPAPVESA